MPVLVGNLGDEVADGLRVVGAQQIAQRPAMDAQADALLFLRLAGEGRSFLGTNGQGLQRLGGTGSNTRRWFPESCGARGRGWFS
ncbi:MAG: hypothetical protein IPG66_13035 [Hydrogenophilales bacterium]|nr:hypothetical protein [Hydrogenophilales bacterium]